MTSSIFILTSIIFVSIVGLGVLFKNSKKLTNIIFSLLCFSILFWLVGSLFMFRTTDFSQVIFWDRFIYIGVVFVPIFMFHFALSFISYKKKILLILGYCLAVFFLIASRTEYFVSDVFEYQWGVHSQAKFLHTVFLVYFFAYIALSYYFLIDFLKKSSNALERNKVKYILLALVVLVLVGSPAFLPAYNIGIYPIPFLSGVFFTLLLAYPIVRYQLMDFRIVIRKSAIFILLTIIFAVVLVLTIFFSRYYLQQDSLVIAILTSLVFVLSFGYIKGLLDKFIKKDEYDLSKNIEELNSGLSPKMGKDDLFTKLRKELIRTLKVEKADFYIYESEGNWKNTPKSNREKSGINDEKLHQYFLTSKKEIVIEEIPYLIDLTRDKKTKEELKDIKKRYGKECSIIVPIYTDNRLKAVGFIGKKKNNHIFNKDDRDYLSGLIDYFSQIYWNYLFYKQTVENIKKFK